jgi:prepilin-type N-terminal cleavage/methylation domain-containing protein
MKLPEVRYQVLGVRCQVGFTLIELLVVISIIGILTAITIPQLTAFNRRQILKNAAAEVKNNLRFAQNKAFAAEVDTNICNVPNAQALRGWYFSVDSTTSYSISGLCANPDTGLTFGTRSFQLPQGLTISMSPSAYILFEPLSKGVSFYDTSIINLLSVMAKDINGGSSLPNQSVEIALTFLSNTRTVTVTGTGEIYDH